MLAKLETQNWVLQLQIFQHKSYGNYPATNKKSKKIKNQKKLGQAKTHVQTSGGLFINMNKEADTKRTL